MAERVEQIGKQLLIDKNLYTRQEVWKHNTLKDLWITYINKVYNVTSTINSISPKLRKIFLESAGTCIEPHINVYKLHDDKELLSLLEANIVGWLKDPEYFPVKEDPYVAIKQPERPYEKDFIVHDRKPYNAEPKDTSFMSEFFTAEDRCYSRNHFPIPDVILNNYALTVQCTGRPIKYFTLEDLQKQFKVHTVGALNQCAGNRRNSLVNKGRIPWDHSVFVAEFQGVQLTDLIQFCTGYTLKDLIKKDALIVSTALDRDKFGKPYSCLMPAWITPEQSQLAYFQNSQPLTRDRGFPLRLVVPGLQAHMSTRWVGKLTIIIPDDKQDAQELAKSAFDSKKPYHEAKYDKIIEMNGKILSTPVLIYEYPVNSYFIPLQPNDRYQEKIKVKGKAFSGGGAKIRKVEVSIDNGKSWLDCNIQDHDMIYTWFDWDVELDKNQVAPNTKIFCRAYDTAGHQQPKDPTWNFNGCGANGWNSMVI